MSNKQLKYHILRWHNTHVREQVTKELSISDKTYYNKINAEIGSSQGFEYCELLIVASILEREVHELITAEALQYYTTHKEEQL